MFYDGSNLTEKRNEFKKYEGQNVTAYQYMHCGKLGFIVCTGLECEKFMNRNIALKNLKEKLDEKCNTTPTVTSYGIVLWGILRNFFVYN
jgi:hypothetical protein